MGTDPCPIKHVIFLVKENHSFDNLFARYPGLGSYGTETAQVGNQQIPLGVMPDRVPTDIAHDSKSAMRAINHGAMDNFNSLPGAIVRVVTIPIARIRRARYLTIGPMLNTSPLRTTSSHPSPVQVFRITWF